MSKTLHCCECGEKMEQKDKTYIPCGDGTYRLEDAFHWQCTKCGEVIFPETTWRRLDEADNPNPGR